MEALNRYTRSCHLPKAEITPLAKRLTDRMTPPPAMADAGDAAALKVEKNALALVFIPAIMTIAEEFIAAHPGVFFYMQQDQPGTVDLSAVRASIDPRNPQAFICHYVNYSLSAVFQHVVNTHVAAVENATDDEPDLIWTAENLLNRYRRAISSYHGHTSQSAQHFTPQGHIMAGINTALFIILRALSAITVLGEAKLGRPLTRQDLAVAVTNSTPLLLTIARCHLEQLLVLEDPLEKQAGDPFLSQLDAPAYSARLEKMFVVAEDSAGLRLELTEAILNSLPLVSSPKPRTGCPALYASTSGNVNVIAALVHMTETAFSGLHFGTAPDRKSVN